MPKFTIRAMLGLVAVLGLLCWATVYQASKARESRANARRIQCLNNLKQIGMATSGYVSREGAFPGGSLPAPGTRPDRELGWGFLIGPSVEELTRHPEEFRVYWPKDASAWDDPRLSFLHQKGESSFHCPTCRSAYAGAGPFPANYVGIAGLGVDAPGLPTSHPRAGIFGDARVVTPADVKDGLANTMMVAESSAPSGPWFAGGRSTVRGLDASRKPYLGPGRQFGGIHGEGANVLMADGSVRWVRPTSTGLGFEAMSTIGGGEVVSDPDDSP